MLQVDGRLEMSQDQILQGLASALHHVANLLVSQHDQCSEGVLLVDQAMYPDLLHDSYSWLANTNDWWLESHACILCFALLQNHVAALHVHQLLLVEHLHP